MGRCSPESGSRHAFKNDLCAYWPRGTKLKWLEMRPESTEPWWHHIFVSRHTACFHSIATNADCEPNRLKGQKVKGLYSSLGTWPSTSPASKRLWIQSHRSFAKLDAELMFLISILLKRDGKRQENPASLGVTILAISTTNNNRLFLTWNGRWGPTLHQAVLWCHIGMHMSILTHMNVHKHACISQGFLEVRNQWDEIYM